MDFGLYLDSGPTLASGPSSHSNSPIMEEPSSKLFCCRWVRLRIPLAHREELYQILRMTGPLLLSRILNYLLPFVITMFCGRLGNAVLAGYGLACATINITTAATGGGLALACDTLVSQTFGGRNLHRVGVILQRSVLILLLFCLPCWAMLINTQTVLLALGQEPEVARHLGHFSILHSISVFQAMFLHQLQASYLQNQVYTDCTAILSITWDLNFPLFVRVCLFHRGSAAANALSQLYICSFLFAYIVWKKLHMKTWGGWTTEALQDWGSYMKLAIPSTLMLCFEWWIYELGGFLAGMLSEVDLAAQHVVIMLAFINYMFPLGIQAAACVRVGNALGAGDRAGAILTSKVSLTLSGVMAVIQGIALMSTKTVIAFMFTSDEQIIELVSQVLTVYSVLQFFDGLVCVSMGIILGTGRQKIAAIANLITYYCVGLPMGTSLMFAAGLRVLGFWLGLLIAVSLLSIFFITVIFRLNWEKMTEKVHCRWLLICLEHAGTQRLVFQKSLFHFLSTLNYTPVNAEDQYDLRGSNGTPEVQRGNGSPTARLSTAQLVLRRGITVLAAIAILTVGTSLHVLLPLPISSWSNMTADWSNITYNTTYRPDLVQTTLLL
uniref:Multidrug and toxin extrusion protein n=1 Tax=Esox lucius TaxID=8010 RepID=A0A6Q2X2I8_ESOLU